MSQEETTHVVAPDPVRPRPVEVRTPFGQTYYPPVPTRFTIRLRTNLVWQLLRFFIINVKMLRMVRKH
jgi:hypothetical protein